MFPVEFDFNMNPWKQSAVIPSSFGAEEEAMAAAAAAMLQALVDHSHCQSPAEDQ